ncbi:unnamed protein product [Lymnaea stagnalis]|uniref:Bax inhibitor 1 n=1 Tax=Lymnaea stagnalis TaxID=6523 RepID=A0AAV2H8D7_LYMST
MAARTSQTTMFSSALFNFDHLESNVQQHLKKVYASLSVGMLSAALGAYAHTLTGIGEWFILTTLASIGLMIWLGSTRYTKESEGTRMGIFAGFTFTSGISLGPLIDIVMNIDESIVSTALAGTAVIFICFTMASLLWKDRVFLYMGGFLMSSLTLLTLGGLINVFFRSEAFFNVYIYGALFLFSAFVLFDTQLIVEKRRKGDQDYIWHSVDLFIDAIQIFRTLLIILAKKSKDSRKKSSK